MTKIFCDRCKREILPDRNGCVSPDSVFTMVVKDEGTQLNLVESTLCHQCFARLRFFMEAKENPFLFPNGVNSL